MTASISAHSTNIASTIIHAYAYYCNLSLCMCHVQPTVYQRNSYCIRDIHVTEAIRSYTPISRAPLIYGIPFTHADILVFPCGFIYYTVVLKAPCMCGVLKCYGPVACKLNICVYAAFILGAGISVDSAPALQAL